MKELIRTLQLVVSAEEHQLDHKPIDEVRLPEIEQARKRLALLRGVDVVNGLIALRRCGLSLNLDLRPQYNHISETPPARSGSGDTPARNLAGLSSKPRR